MLPTMKRRRYILATVFIVIAAGVVSLPTFRDLYSISKMKEQYLVDDAVHSQLGPKEATAEEMLNPPFMKKYGLSMSEYLDEDGYFSPKGFHWKRWNIET